MSKKIRFPLKLAGDTQARTLKELREYFDLEIVLGHYKSGKLLTWLEDRYLEGEAEAVKALDETSPDFQRQLCAVFQVEYTGDDVDMEEVERRQERLKHLRTITDDAEFIQNIDRVAFDQEELADLLDAGEVRIYLCGDEFTVPASCKGLTYVGIENPTIHISGKIPETVEELEITFHKCIVDNLPHVPEKNTTQSKEEPCDYQEPSAEKTAATGIVERLELECGRNGERIPQIYFKEHIYLDKQYDHVPVLSAELFEALDLRKGSVVNVHRVGDVIPSITVVERGRGDKLRLPSECPHCRKELIIKNKKLMCPNVYCAGNIVGKYAAFLEAIGVEGYGDAFLNELVERYYDPDAPDASDDFVLNDYGSISRLVDLDEDDMKSYGMTDKLSLEFPGKIQAALEDVQDYVIVGAMGWPDIGPERAKALLKHYGSAAKLIKGFDQGGMCHVWKEAIGEIGYKTGWYFMNNRHLMEAIRSDLEHVMSKVKNFTDFAITRPRVGHTGLDIGGVIELRGICKSHNAELVDGRSFDILVTADMNSTSAKMEKAKKNGIPIIETRGCAYSIPKLLESQQVNRSAD